MTEIEYLSEVYRIAADASVYCHHCKDGRVCVGPGLPDCLLVGPSGVLWREIKVGNPQPSPSQTALIWTLRAAGQDARVWTVADLRTGTVAREIETIA